MNIRRYACTRSYAPRLRPDSNPKTHHVQSRLDGIQAAGTNQIHAEACAFPWLRGYNRGMSPVRMGIICVLFGIPVVYAQNAPATPAKSNDTSYVTCGNKPATSRTVSSDIFVSPDGKRRA